MGQLVMRRPCALGLAVPAVQVAAAGLLFTRGALLKSGDALERLGQIDTVIFDKTGTLTEGAPSLMNAGEISDADMKLASSLAAASRHPLARALVRHTNHRRAREGVIERPGLGLTLETDEGEVRLGSRVWCGVPDDQKVGGPPASELWLRRADGVTTLFRFRDRLRVDAPDAVDWLIARGIQVRLLSGDRDEAVEAMAQAIGIADWRGQQSPQDKIQAVSDLQRRGHRVAMIGDGLNDAPALAAADVSLSPSSAAEVSQNAADIVYLDGKLATIPFLIDAAGATVTRVKQNFLLASLYNVLAIPLAIFGFVTPLVAALAMSGSSLIVTANALRPFRKGAPNR